MNNDITIYDASGNVRTTLGLYVGAKGTYTLGTEDSITLPFLAPEPVPFAVGDWCDLSQLEDTTLATHFRRRFEVLEPPFPTYDATTGGYRYELKLHAYYWAWKNKICKYFGASPQGQALGSKETSWSLTADLGTHLAVVQRNLADYGITYNGAAFQPTIDTTVTTDAKLVSYSSTSITDALTTLATTFECEWWVEENNIKFGRMELLENTVACHIRNWKNGALAYYDAATNTTRWKIGADPTATDTKWNIIMDGSGRFYILNSASGTYLLNMNGGMTATPTPMVFLHGTDYTQVSDVNTLPDNIVIQTTRYPVGQGGNIYLHTKGHNTDAQDGVMEGYNRTELASHWQIEVEHVKLQLGREVASMERNASDGVFATRLYVYGAERNIPTNYRPTLATDTVQGIAQKRLMMPSGTPFLDAYRYDAEQRRVYLGETTYDSCQTMPSSEAVEAVMVNDDIYPSFKANVSAVTSWAEKATLQDGTDAGYNQRFYIIQTADFLFQESFLLPNTDPTVTFTSGKCNGMTFTVTFHATGMEKMDQESGQRITVSGQCFELVANEDWGRRLPDELICPTAGDEFILAGWDATQFAEGSQVPTTQAPFVGRVEEAERKLKEWGEQYIRKTMVDDGVYKCTLASHWAAQDGQTATTPTYRILRSGSNYIRVANPVSHSFLTSPADADTQQVTSVFHLGQRVQLLNPAFFDNTRISRIIGYEIKLDIPSDAPVYTIGESVQYSLLGTLESKVEEIAMNGASVRSVGGRSSGIYLIKRTDTTVTPTDTNAFSAARTVQQFVDKDAIVATHNTDKPHDTEHLLSAYASDNTYLNKRADSDTIQGLIRFLQGLIIGDYTSGMLGAGAFFGKDTSGNESYLEVDKLTVRHIAKFFELVIQKVSHTGGELIMSPASATLTKVVRYGADNQVLSDDAPASQVTVYSCYFNNQDGDTTVQNLFKNGDLAYCQTFANNQSRRWWRRVAWCGDDRFNIMGDASGDGLYLSGSDEPKAGDVVVQLGSTLADRQSAIILSTIGDDAPSIKMYSGINTFSLDGKAHTWFSKGGNRIKGDFFTTSGTDVSSAIQQTSQSLSAVVSDVNTLMNSGFIAYTQFASLFANQVTQQGIAHTAEISTAVSNGIATATIQADRINIGGGLFTANEYFKVTPEGKVEAKDGEFGGVLKSTLTKLTASVATKRYIHAHTNNGSSDIDSQLNKDSSLVIAFDGYQLRDSVNLDCTRMPQTGNVVLNGHVVLPSGTEWIGTHAILVNTNYTTSSDMASWVVREDGGHILGLDGVGMQVAEAPTIIRWQAGVIELICTDRAGTETDTDWWILNFNAHQKDTSYNGTVYVDDNDE